MRIGIWSIGTFFVAFDVYNNLLKFVHFMASRPVFIQIKFHKKVKARKYDFLNVNYDTIE